MAEQERGACVAVRPYREQDKQAVRDICVATSGLPDGASPEQKRRLLLQYCDYYVEQEPEACFVAENEAGEPVGYILCAADFKAYRRRFLRNYLPQIRALDRRRAFAVRLELWLIGRFARHYPAHMHIDILTPFQRRGIGHRLVDALTASLAGRRIRGLMLIVGAENEKGVRFYEKYGFQRLAGVQDALVMGLQVSK
ncbi:MAG TPA: GNAT family N-acetyltransferase [Candidatus Fimivicinus intestinavium]|nr:GNAT family N-acetyltransferase [Candidatus Fimivicinus intestinavium]